MTAEANQPKESKGERVKRASRFLRGTITEVLDSDADSFGPDDVQLLKFHGMYQQYDRDARRTGGQGASARQYQFLLRLKIPGGRISAEQYLAVDALAGELGNGTLRVTSRQGLQLHGVLKGNLRATIGRINAMLLTTRGACGDVSRNVMMCPAPGGEPARERVVEFGRRIAQDLAPSTWAYHEIWLGGEKVATTENEEPFYGAQYLPRKFKTALAMPGDNCVDVYTHDVGMVPVIEGSRLRGVNLLVGGGLGQTHGKADTFARLATELGFVEADRVVEVVKTIAALFRDHGNRADRRHARLKYLIHDWGMDRFRAELKTRLGFRLEEWVAVDALTLCDHLGRHETADGNVYLGVHVPSGRIKDSGTLRLGSAMRAAVSELRPQVAFTPQQNVLLTGLSEQAADRLTEILVEHGVPFGEAVSPVQKFSMVCTALPTCGLAIAEAERVMPKVLEELEAELVRLGLSAERISVRMTGCPNGCARPYTADLSFVGRTSDTYEVYAGGRLAGDRLVDLYARKVPLASLVETVRPLLKAWRDGREAGESFGDYYQRVHHKGPPVQILRGA